MIGRLKDLLRLSGGEWLVSFTTRDDPRKIINTLNGADVEISMKKYNPHRSKDANALCWAMCSDIGKALNPPIDKLEVYRKAIRAVGVFMELTVKTWDVDKIRSRWSTHGDGWFVDVIDDAGIGRKTVHLYFGSSTYSRDEMRVLLDWLVDEGEQLGIIPRMSREDEERALAQWGKASCKPNGNVISAAV